MTKHVAWIVAVITIFFSANSVYPQEPVRVLVLPFKIHSMKELSYMRAQIPEVIKKHLKQAGAVIPEEKTAPDLKYKSPVLKYKNIDQIKQIGVKNGADYMVWGSLTWIEDRFSLDAKMVKTFGEASPDNFFIEGKGIENLLGGVKQLADNISFKLFKLEKIVEVQIEGNKRIEVDVIKKIIKTRPGNVYLAKSLSDDLKAIYATGYFDDIRIEAEDGPEGKTIIFKIKEKPTIRLVELSGNKTYEDNKVMDAIDIKTGSILNILKIQDNIKRIEDFYKENNYHNIEVSYKIKELDNNQADLEFVITEGEKTRIKSIIFDGNSAYIDKELKKIIKTQEKGFFSWLTSSGELNLQNLNQDASVLYAFYHNHGYSRAKVGEPVVEYKDNYIFITFKIVEGPRFKVGKVDVSGDLVLPREELIKKLKITKEEFFNREVVRNDMLALTDIYSDEGYAYAQISPRTKEDPEKLIIDIDYAVEKANQIYFEKIIIGGNTKTRDKVIRRELKVYEQELYSGTLLKRGVRRLHRLDYFEDIKVDTVKGSSDDKTILKINVTEKATGAFSFGGGYSSVENAFLMASISQRNLFGRGQRLQLKAQIGSRSTRFNLSFTEPWLFDTPLSAGFELYNWAFAYEDYDRDSKGGTIRFGYAIYDFTRVYLSYSYDLSDIDDIDEDASQSIKDLEGENITSSISSTLRYDSRNKAFNATEGQNHSFIVQYAGIGGDIGFTKYIAEAGWYIPLLWKTVGFLHGKGGYVSEGSGKILPDYDRFYLGGINSIRGFDWHDICSYDENGDEIGGDKFVQFNIEWLMPLLKDGSLVGLVFYDTGNVYNNGENMDIGNLRKSVGFGCRWYSPMGPLRIEYGYVLDKKEGESSSRWEFSMGSAF